jgi:aminopeptidase N
MPDMDVPRRRWQLQWAGLYSLAFIVALSGCSPVVGPDSTSSVKPSPPASVPATTTSSASTTTSEPGFEDAGLGGLVDPGSLGNPGYDVLHYDLDLDYDPASRLLSAEVRLTSTATTNLNAINVDFIGFDVTSVTLDGAEVVFGRSDNDLVIVLPTPIARDDQFSMSIKYEGVPEPFVSSAFSVIPLGWRSRDGFDYVVASPDAARTWFPGNDHPSDKATYRFRITVPSYLSAAANGVLTDATSSQGRTTWTWEMRDPMASYLATVIIGNFSMIEDLESTSVSGVPVRNLLPANYDLAEDFGQDALAEQGEMIRFFSDLFGPYPFDTYGIALVPELQGGLETQSLPVVGGLSSGLLVHELAHQWFGNHVSVSDWVDNWLSEGFSTYATWLWYEHTGLRTVAESASIEYDRMRLNRVPPGDPPYNDVFNTSVYGRGALTLHALRSEIGDDSFFAVLREWVDQYGGTSASTEDFIAVAEEVSSVHLDDLFDEWLYQATLPPSP